MSPKRKISMKIGAGILVILFVAAAFGAKVLAPLPAGDVLAVRTLSGGYCQGGTCNSETKLYSNGRFGDKTLTTDQVQILKRLLAETDLSSYKKVSDPNCPSYTDGQDIGYKFPAKTGDTQYILCTLEIPDNDPLFQYLSVL